MEEEQERPGGILGWIEANPLLSIVIAVAASIVLFAFISNRPNNEETLRRDQGDLSGLEEDAFGNKILYLPVENFFNNISEISGSYNNPITTGSHNTTTSHTSIENNPPPPPPPPVVQPPPAVNDPTRGRWIAKHTVKRGETLKSLASNFRHLGINITAEDLYSHNRNNIDSTAQGHHDRARGADTKIYVGQVLTVPSLGTYWSNKNRRYEPPGTPPYPSIPVGGIG